MPKKVVSLLISYLFFSFAYSSYTIAAKPIIPKANSTKEVFNKFKDSVVQIRIIDKTTHAKTTIGSGFFVSSTGIITTNYHVISEYVFDPEQNQIEYVLHDFDKTKKVYLAELINIDVTHDLALLQAKGSVKTPYLKLNHKDLKKGEKILSLGNPHDLGMAIITGTYNGITDDSMNERIHLSGAINSGMSGGPSITSSGKIIGVNVATSGNQIGFLVPGKYLSALLKNEDKPKNFIQHIGKQILINQDNYIAAILSKPIPTKVLADFNVPDKIANYLTCWGDSDSSDLPYKSSGNSCATKNHIFLAEDFTTGDIHYSQYHLSAKQISKFRFAYILEDYFENPGTHLFGSKNYFTNYQCKTDFVKNNNINFKLAFCLRGYKDFNGIYDMMLSAVTISDKTSGMQTSLILSGVSYKNAITLSEKYLAAFSKVAINPNQSRHSKATKDSKNKETQVNK